MPPNDRDSAEGDSHRDADLVAAGVLADEGGLDHAVAHDGDAGAVLLGPVEPRVLVGVVQRNVVRDGVVILEDNVLTAERRRIRRERLRAVLPGDRNRCG